MITPQREDLTSHKLKESRSMKNQKVTKRNLNAALATVTEEVSSLTRKELSEFSPISEASDVTKRSLNAASPTVTEEVSSETRKELSDFSPISEASDSSVLASASPVSSEASYSNISKNSENPSNVTVNHCVFHKPDGSVEVDIVSSFLQKSRNQVLSSSDVDDRSKKILDAVLKVVLDELPEERDICAELLSARGRILLLCILLWSFILSAILFSGLLSDSSYYGPLPT